MNKHKIGTILCMIFCTAFVMSNIVGVKIIKLFFFELPASILIYPITYIINGIFAEAYGLKRAKEIVYAGFFTNIFAAAVILLTIWLPASESYALANEFNNVLSSSIRVLLACFISYISGSLLKSYVTDNMRRKKAFNNNLLYRSVASTFFGQSVDSVLFITIAFSGTVSTGIILTMIISQIIAKTLYEIIFYPVTKRIIFYIKALPDN